jgi:enoyl-CoA hydratase
LVKIFHYVSNLADPFRERILTDVINRVEKMNALNKEVLTELNQVLDEVERNPEVRSVIITGAGSKAFVAGADISEFNGLNKEEAMTLAKRARIHFSGLKIAVKPIVAAVNGLH